jgi:hypothetical protein
MSHDFVFCKSTKHKIARLWVHKRATLFGCGLSSLDKLQQEGSTGMDFSINDELKALCAPLERFLAKALGAIGRAQEEEI